MYNKFSVVPTKDIFFFLDTLGFGIKEFKQKSSTWYSDIEGIAYEQRPFIASYYEKNYQEWPFITRHDTEDGQNVLLLTFDLSKIPWQQLEKNIDNIKKRFSVIKIEPLSCLPTIEFVLTPYIVEMSLRQKNILERIKKMESEKTTRLSPLYYQ